MSLCVEKLGFLSMEIPTFTIHLLFLKAGKKVAADNHPG